MVVVFLQIALEVVVVVLFFLVVIHILPLLLRSRFLHQAVEEVVEVTGQLQVLLKHLAALAL